MREMDRPDFLRVIEARSRDQFRQRVQRRAMIVVNTSRLVGHDERSVTGWVLRRHTGRAPVSVTTQGLDATEREHEAARGIAPIRAKTDSPRDVESSGNFSRRSYANAMPRIDSDQS